MNNLIELSNINKTFINLKKISVLKKVSYKFKKGKIYSLMGPSGSGKSTLLNILSLIDRPNAGSIIIEKNHVDFKNLQKNDLLRAKKIGRHATSLATFAPKRLDTESVAQPSPETNCLFCIGEALPNINLGSKSRCAARPNQLIKDARHVTRIYARFNHALQKWCRGS